MDKKSGAKLPVKQLVVLSICRIAEPVALTSVYPYIPEMMEYVGVVGESEVAFWSGVTVAMFSLCQGLTGVPWGRASDRYGRKPVILVGMVCTMLTSVAFGMSRSLAYAMCVRALAGLGSGTVGIIRTTVAEMVPQRDLQPRAFSVMPFVWSLGSIFGPAFGGFFANPSRRWGWHSAFFEMFPFALPNLIGAGLFLIGLAAGWLFLDETLDIKKRKRDRGRVLGRRIARVFRRRDPASEETGEGSPLLRTTSTTSSKEARPTPPLRDVFTRQSSLNLVAYSLLALHSVAYDQLLPIFLHHPKRSNMTDDGALRLRSGFGLNSREIGLIFTIYGGGAMFAQFVIFPPVVRKVGLAPCLRVCAVVLPLIYAATPFVVFFHTEKARYAAVIALLLLKALAGVHGFSSSTILLINSAPSLRVLGSLNGFATSLSAFGRAAGPAIGGATFSLGVKVDWLLIPFWTIACFAIAGAIPVWWLIEGDGPAAEPEEEQVEREREREPNEAS